MRGIDSEGHVANFVETEQITIHDNMRASFVQVSVLFTYLIAENSNGQI